MLEFKNPDEVVKLKRKLKVLDVERNELGELSRLYVEDSIFNDAELNKLIPINKENMDRIVRMIIYPEFKSARQMVEIYAQELKKQIKSEYIGDTDLPVTDKALFLWAINNDYLGAITTEGNRLVVNPEIYDIEFELKLEVIYKGYTAYRLVKSILKGYGTEGFTNPEDVVLELVKNIPSYLDKDYKLPVLEGATWSIVGENENDVVIEDNTIKISKLKNVGDGRIILKAEYMMGEDTASVEMYITVVKPYFFDTFNYEMERVMGNYQKLNINIESNNNKPLYVVAKDPTKSFSISHDRNNSNKVTVNITEESSLHDLSKYGTEEFVITFDIYTDSTKQYLYGSEQVIISYYYGPAYTLDRTEEIMQENDDNGYAIFNIYSETGEAIYANVSIPNEFFNVDIFNTDEGDLILVVSAKEDKINGDPGSSNEYNFELKIYSDEECKNSLGTVEYTINYIFSPTDPLD